MANIIELDRPTIAPGMPIKIKRWNGFSVTNQSYAYNQASQRTAETNTAGDFRNYTYDNIGELKTAVGKEAGGTTNRWHEQLGYAYDAAGNLNYRTNNGLLGVFNVNDLNELSMATRSGTLTVAGTTTIPATSVTVNSSNAILYADATFAATNMPLVNGTNTFTAVGQDSYGHLNTNISTCYLPATNSFSYDLNGNLLNDTNRNFAYDDENQLISVYVTNAWRCDFVYDGKFRQRVEKDYAWQGGTWIQTNEIHFIYDGNVVIQERNVSNIPQVTYTRSGSTLLARTDYGQEIPGAPTTAYYHLDGNANVTMLIYANQIVAAKYQYGPFGEMLSLSGPLAPFNTYRFASKEWNDRAGIYYFGRRYYDPIIIRFLNRDPLAEQGGINLYAYVANNPINIYDDLGLMPCWLQNLLNALLGPDDSGYNPLDDPFNPENLLNPLSPYYINPNSLNNGPFSPNLSAPNNQPSLFNPGGSLNFPAEPLVAGMNWLNWLQLVPIGSKFVNPNSELEPSEEFSLPSGTPPPYIEPAGTFGGETVAAGSGSTIGEGVTGFTIDSGTLMETTTGTLIEGTAAEAGGEGTIEIIIVIIAGSPVGI